MNEKERLIRALEGEEVDRPPVICPGGMMNGAVTELVQDIDKNHNADVDAMVETAKKVYQKTGFENYGVPFCMTIECEPLGVEVDLGDKQVEPRVLEYNQSAIEEIIKSTQVNPLRDKRMPVVLEAIRQLKNDQVPVIGNITGPISTATSIIDPLVAFKMILKKPEEIASFFDYVNNYSIDFAREMIKAGADVIAISDPTATGEILGAKNFEKFAIPLYDKMIKAIHDLNVPVILHICGKARNILNSLNLISADALSFDSSVNMKYAKSVINARLMGNINTLLLHKGQQEKIISITKNSINSGVDIVAPACGLSMETPVENLKAATDYVKKGKAFNG